jgi:DNA (cytosine-5)-methyltransferase 1
MFKLPKDRPCIIDLYCGAGGAARGFQQAGFYVVGVDIKRQPNYIGDEFYQADAIQFFNEYGGMFDAVHASPPCQAHTVLKKMWNAKQHEDFIPATREALMKSGLPYVIENVPGAPLASVVKLCGTMFGLKSSSGAELRRHRFFESNILLLSGLHCKHGKSAVLGVYGGHVRDRCRVITVTGHTPQMNVVKNRVRETFTVDEAREAMGIDWMNMQELSQAIPPAYTQYLGVQLMNFVRSTEKPHNNACTRQGAGVAISSNVGGCAPCG